MSTQINYYSLHVLVLYQLLFFRLDHRLPQNLLASKDHLDNRLPEHLNTRALDNRLSSHMDNRLPEHLDNRLRGHLDNMLPGHLDTRLLGGSHVNSSFTDEDLGNTGPLFQRDTQYQPRPGFQASFVINLID